MATRCEQSRTVREAVCIDTKRVYDSCRDRDCMRDMQVSFPRYAGAIIDRAVSIKAKSAELIWADIDVEPITFNKGYYTVNVRYYFRVEIDVYTGAAQQTTIYGVAVYDKTAILYGSEGSSRTFSSKYSASEREARTKVKTNMPEASVEVVDPVILQARLEETDDSCCGCCCPCDPESFPPCVRGCFDDEIVFMQDKEVYVSIGMFSIIRLSRNVQLLVPVYDFCIPTKECDPGSDSSDDPCELFAKFNFPFDDFFPPNSNTGSGACNCG